ncbi:unnamed protein product [Orchesella dallaii]|uniref:Uncharacterized protein n=1 Tax=Orchesella dallaii TaxID=48710 RepID=A0ABP1RQL0_9HEXA
MLLCLPETIARLKAAEAKRDINFQKIISKRAQQELSDEDADLENENAVRFFNYYTGNRPLDSPVGGDDLHEIDLSDSDDEVLRHVLTVRYEQIGIGVFDSYRYRYPKCLDEIVELVPIQTIQADRVFFEYMRKSNRIEVEIDIPGDTLVCADLAKEITCQKGEEINRPAFHIIDGLRLGGKDIRDMEYGKLHCKTPKCEIT